MINQETIQRILDAVHIEEVVGEFVSLKKRGTNFIGCCPFHNEKTPSFVVSPAKGIYKCFGCGKAGDAVRFLMDHEHYTYPEALRYLAKKYNIHIEEEQLTKEQQERNSERDALFHVSEYAQKYFADLLYNDEMGSAIGLSYFHQRGLTDEIIKSFGLGYCKDQWSDFTDHALSQGFSQNVLDKTGLTILKENGKKFDRFRGRVMFPIYSISGRVLGFSGRILTKDKQAAKYVNSPDSEIYNKSRILYGLYQARTAITKADKCYLVEGNVDVVSMHQSGVCNTVASCGTSLTVEQIRLIKRYTTNVTVLYDGDSAGIKAALRAVNMLFEEGLHVRVVLFPEGEDPDSYAQKNGSTQLQTYLAEHEENFILFKTHLLLDDVKKDPISKSRVLREIVETIALVPDLLERTEYVSLCASKLSMPEATLQAELAKVLNNRRQKEWDKNHPQEEGQPEEAPAEEPAEVTQEETQAQLETKRENLTLNPDEEFEHKIIKLLLNHGKEMIEETCVDDEGKKYTDTFAVAVVLVDGILDDGLRFENELYQQIFNEIASKLEDEQILDGLDFVNHPDEKVRNLTTSMLVSAYQVSDQWEKKNIFVPNLSMLVKRDVDESLFAFKQKKLEHRIEQNAKEIKVALENKNDDELMMLVNEKVLLDRMKVQIGERLHRIIIPKF